MPFPPNLIPGSPSWLALELAPSTPLKYPLDSSDLPAGLPAVPSTPLACPLAYNLPAGLANSPALSYVPRLMPGCPSWVALELDASL